MTRKNKFFICIMALAAITMSLAGCSDRKSYAELLADENIYCNNFLADHKVIGYEERDSTFNFEYGADAPYYQLDEDGIVYMQVINPGTPDNRAYTDQLIYFRFTRYNLMSYENGKLSDGAGNNENINSSDASFRFSNMSSYNSYQWGAGIQMPLIYLPIDCEVNLVIKSQYGLYSEISNVIPFLYNVRYFKSQI